MHSVLALEIAVGVVAFDVDGDRLYAGVVAFEKLRDRCLISVAFGIAEIEAHEHLGPVLTLCAACAGIDLQHHAEFVFLTAKHIAQLKGLDVFCHDGILLVDLFFRDEAFLHEVECKPEFLHLLLKRLIGIDPEMKVFDLLHLGLCLLTVFPEVRNVGAEFLFLHLDLLGIDVEVSFEGGGAFLRLFQLFLCYHRLLFLLRSCSRTLLGSGILLLYEFHYVV